MKSFPQKIYLDTSVPSNYYDIRPLEQVGSTRIFWSEVLPKFQPYVSPLTVREIEKTPHNPTRSKILKLVEKCHLLTEPAKIEEKAYEYVLHNLIPQKYLSDALHIALATFHEMDYLVTWNMKHIAGAEQRTKITRFNESKSLFVPTIITPEELNKKYYEQDRQ